MNHLIKYLFFSLLFLSACQSNTPNESSQSDAKFSKKEIKLQQESWDKVMKIHDAIMPQMGALDKVGVDIDNALKEATDEKEVKQLNDAKQKIKAADKLMWDWMYALVQLKELRANKSHEEIMAYLSNELNRIKKVKEKMEKSIKIGSELTKK